MAFNVLEWGRIVNQIKPDSTVLSIFSTNEFLVLI